MSTEVAKLESLNMIEVQQDVQKYEAMLEQMKADYLPVLDIPINDKKQLDIVKAARINFKNTRLEGVGRLDAGCKALYANWKLWVKARDTFEKKFEDVEVLFREKEKAFEDAEEQKALAEAKAWAERMNLRKQAAFDIGYYFNGVAYLLDRENGEAPWVLNEDQVAGMAMSDEALYTLLDAQAAELKMTREIKAEAEAKAEEERLAKEAAAKAEADRIAAAQAEIERKEKEMAEKERKMNDRINEVRKAELIAAGMTLDDPDDGLPFGPSLVLVDMCLPVHALHSMTDEQYTEAIAEAKRQKAELDEYNRQREEEARVQRERQEQERIAREEQLKAEAAQRAIAEERERVEREREAKEREEALRAQQEADRIASMGDKELVEQLSLYLVSAPIPELHTAIGKHGMERVRKHLDELIKMVNAIAKDL